jgi:hypothetical protein
MEYMVSPGRVSGNCHRHKDPSTVLSSNLFDSRPTPVSSDVHTNTGGRTVKVRGLRTLGLPHPREAHSRIPFFIIQSCWTYTEAQHPASKYSRTSRQCLEPALHHSFLSQRSLDSRRITSHSTTSAGGTTRGNIEELDLYHTYPISSQVTRRYFGTTSLRNNPNSPLSTCPMSHGLRYRLWCAALCLQLPRGR